MSKKMTYLMSNYTQSVVTKSASFYYVLEQLLVVRKIKECPGGR